MKIIKYTALLILVMLNGCTTFSSDAEKVSLGVPETPEVIVNYFAALDAIEREGSTILDIENLLAITTESVHYVHKNFDANFDKPSWLKAFKRNLKAGANNLPSSFCTQITKSINGKNSVAVEYTRGAFNMDNVCIPDDETRNLAIFHIKDDKINLIEELW